MIIKFLKDNKYFLLGLAVLLFAVFANAFPKGYVFAGGDTAQLISAKTSFSKFFYDWDGRASTFYFIFYLLDLAGVSDSGQLSWYLGIFIVGSYLSFSIFTKLIFEKASDVERMLVSLFYALNLYTLLIFTENWGYSYFQSLYIFIPLIFALYIKFLETGNFRFGALFCLSLFLASSGFGNPAFALSFGIVLFFLTLFFFVFRLANPRKDIFLKIALTAICAILISAYWALPIIPTMSSGVALLFSGNALDLNWWISHTANPISRTLVLLNGSGDYFPDNFPYKSIESLKSVFIFLAFLPAMAILYSLFSIHKFQSRNRKIFFVFSGILILLILLTGKVRPPFEVINFHIFNTWGLNTMRSWEKCAIHVPFVFSVLLSIFLIEFRKSRWAYGVFFLILLLPLPFYAGKIQQNLSYRFSNARAENKDFRKAKLSFLVKIPKEYYDIRNIINNDKEKFFVAKLPYSSNDGSGISNYPKWKLYGVDITNYIYEKNYIESNQSYFGKGNFAEEFGNQGPGESYDWIIDILGMENAKYIIYHKDNPEESVENTQYKMDQLEKEELIKKIKDNQYFTLYEINPSYVAPYLSWQDDSAKIVQDPEMIKRSARDVLKETTRAQFQEINPKKLSVDIESGQKTENLILAEAYNPNWKAYAIDELGRESELKNHFLARGYANGWGIPAGADAKKITIEYYPFRLMWKGLIITLIIALLLMSYLACPIALKLFRRTSAWKK
jgi:hypothetical protein